jgi:hypothetical protein
MYRRDQAGRSGAVHKLSAQFGIVSFAAGNDDCPPEKTEPDLSGMSHSPLLLGERPTMSGEASTRAGVVTNNLPSRSASIEPRSN